MLKKHSVLIETIVHVDIEKLLMVIKALQLGPAKKKKKKKNGQIYVLKSYTTFLYDIYIFVS